MDEQRKNTDARYLGHPLIVFRRRMAGMITNSPEGRKCHYLQFLINTSNFTWRKRPEEIEESEIFENNLHLLSKMCHRLHADGMQGRNVTRAVIGMDGKQSEVGDSNGRSGKSLVGELMRQVVDTVYISGKRTDIFNDSFITE